MYLRYQVICASTVDLLPLPIYFMFYFYLEIYYDHFCLLLYPLTLDMYLVVLTLCTRFWDVVWYPWFYISIFIVFELFNSILGVSPSVFVFISLFISFIIISLLLKNSSDKCHYESCCLGHDITRIILS